MLGSSPVQVKQLMWKCLSCTLRTSPIHVLPHMWHKMTGGREGERGGGGEGIDGREGKGGKGKEGMDGRGRRGEGRGGDGGELMLNMEAAQGYT